MTPEMLWNLARQGLAMMFSAGMGVQDLVRNSIWEIGEQMTGRRDVFLERIKRNGSMPVTNLEELRFSHLNTTKLFDQTVLDRAIEKTAEVKSGKVQSELLYKVSKCLDPNNTGGQTRPQMVDSARKCHVGDSARGPATAMSGVFGCQYGRLGGHWREHVVKGQWTSMSRAVGCLESDGLLHR